MKAIVRPTVVVAAVVVTAVYVNSSNRSSLLREQTHGERDAVDSVSRAAATAKAPAAVPTRRLVDAQDLSASDDGSVSSRDRLDDIGTQEVDEDSVRKRVRESAEHEIRHSYFLLFEDLGLTEHDEDELFTFLVENRIAGMRTISRDGAELVLEGSSLDPGERSTRIEAIIGFPKLQQFLALERNLASYSEVRGIESMLERNGAPLTETQRDGLFDILVGTRRGPHETIPSDVERDSVEFLKYVIAELDEREHHVIELAPSVLSSQQVAYLDEQYRECSHDRSDFAHKVSRYIATDLGKELPPIYPSWACIH